MTPSSRGQEAASYRIRATESEVRTEVAGNREHNFDIPLITSESELGLGWAGLGLAAPRLMQTQPQRLKRAQENNQDLGKHGNMS